MEVKLGTKNDSVLLSWLVTLPLLQLSHVIAIFNLVSEFRVVP